MRSWPRATSRSPRRSSPTGAGGSPAALALAATALAVAFETWPHRGLDRLGRPPRRARRAGAVRPVGGSVVARARRRDGVRPRARRVARRRGPKDGDRRRRRRGRRRLPHRPGRGRPRRAARRAGARRRSLGIARARRRRTRAAGCPASRWRAPSSLVSGGVAAAGLSPGGGRVDWRGWDPFAGGGRPRTSASSGTRATRGSTSRSARPWCSGYALPNAPSTGGCRRSRRSRTTAGSSTSSRRRCPAPGGACLRRRSLHAATSGPAAGSGRR